MFEDRKEGPGSVEGKVQYFEMRKLEQVQRQLNQTRHSIKQGKTEDHFNVAVPCILKLGAT